MIGLEPALEAHDRLLVPPGLDLGLVAIELSIEHRMGAQAIGAAFQKIGLAALAHRMHGAARGGFDRDHVHAVDRFGCDPIARRLALDVGFRFRDRQRRSHGVEIVLAHEQHRQCPQRGEIEALVKLAFGDGALAEEAGGDDVLAAHVIGERKPDRQRQSAADDGVAAIEIGGAIEQVHGAAASAAAAFLLAVHLGERRRHRHAAHERMAVLAIGGDDPVALLQHRDDADGDRLFAVIEMQEAADLFLRVELRALVLEAADADHLLQQIQRMCPRQPRLVGGVRHRSSLSSVEISPSGRPSSRALSRRRMILPLRVFGRFWRKAMSLGATAGPRRCARMAEQLLAQAPRSARRRS